MKKQFVFMFLFFLALVLHTSLSAQAVNVQADNPFNPGMSLEQLVSWQTGLAAVLMTLLTYISPFLPIGFVQKATPVVKYITVAVAVGCVFLFIGFANGWQLALSFIISSVVYSNFLSPLGFKTAKAKRAKLSEA